MDCQQARDWLLNADELASASPALRDHVANCPACQLLTTQLTDLEASWRALPTPASAEQSRQAFLDRHCPVVPALPARQQRRDPSPLRWALVALLLLGIGTASWLFLTTPQAVAAAPVLEQLVDWNLDLAEAGSMDERNRIYAAQQSVLQQAVNELPAEERELAALLLDNGSLLARHHDPMTEAERFSAVADKLAEKLQSAAQGKDHPAVDRYVRLQTQVAKRGVSDRLTKAEESGVLNFDAERRLEKLILRDSKRMKQLVDLLERDPDLKRKEIRQELEVSAKLPRPLADLTFEFDLRAQPAVVGEPTVCRVHLKNRSKNPLAKLQLVVTLPEELEVLEAKGPHGYRREGQQVIFRPLANLPPGQDAAFEVQVKPVRTGTGKCRAELRSKQSGYRPVTRQIDTTIVAEGR